MVTVSPSVWCDYDSSHRHTWSIWWSDLTPCPVCSWNPPWWWAWWTKDVSKNPPPRVNRSGLYLFLLRPGRIYIMDPCLCMGPIRIGWLRISRMGAIGFEWAPINQFGPHRPKLNPNEHKSNWTLQLMAHSDATVSAGSSGEHTTTPTIVDCSASLPPPAPSDIFPWNPAGNIWAFNYDPEPSWYKWLQQVTQKRENTENAETWDY